MTIQKLDRWLAIQAIGLLKLYQKTLSPDHSKLGKCFPYRGCRFYPSCSMYAIENLAKRGFMKSILPALWRVLRCNPWSKGGVDTPS